MKEDAAPASGWGKWSHPGVPHKGWTCVGVIDLGPDYADRTICEMCETTSIRFVHHMEHPDYVEILSCGCVCAGHMQGDLASAQHRDKLMRNRAARRDKFPHLKGWSQRPNGNFQIQFDGYRIVMFKRNGMWCGVVNDGYWSEGQFTDKKPDLDAAKLAVFDFLNRTNG